MRERISEKISNLISVPPVIAPFSFSPNDEALNEGAYASLMCNIQYGDMPVSITWSVKGDVVSSEPGITTALLGSRASVLSIDSIGYRHSGVYTCIAKNKAGTTSYSSELKVNGWF